MQPTPTHAVYVYCVVKSARRPSVARAPHGLPGGTRPAVTAVTAPLWLVTSRVPLDRYGPAQLEPRLGDLTWVSKLAVAHEAVVEHFARAPGATVVPMKLLTMFSSLERAVDDVRARRAVLARVMRRVAGCQEWGVRIVRNTGEVAAGRTRPPGRTHQARESSGTAFLAARKEVRDGAHAARLEAIAAAEAAFDRLRRKARDAVRRDSAPDGIATPPILDAAFLVPVRAAARFKTEARLQAAACASAGAAMTLSGPWPAYNFVETAEETS